MIFVAAEAFMAEKEGNAKASGVSSWRINRFTVDPLGVLNNEKAPPLFILYFLQYFPCILIIRIQFQGSFIIYGCQISLAVL